jgi:hypothetical protein
MREYRHNTTNYTTATFLIILHQLVSDIEMCSAWYHFLVNSALPASNDVAVYEIEKIWNKEVEVYLRYYPGIWLETHNANTSTSLETGIRQSVKRGNVSVDHKLVSFADTKLL